MVHESSGVHYKRTRPFDTSGHGEQKLNDLPQLVGFERGYPSIEQLTPESLIRVANATGKWNRDLSRVDESCRLPNYIFGAEYSDE